MADYYFVDLHVGGSETEITGMRERLDADTLYASVGEIGDDELDAYPTELIYRFDSKSLVKTVDGLKTASALFPEVEVNLEYRNPNYQEAGVILISCGAIASHKGMDRATLPD